MTVYGLATPRVLALFLTNSPCISTYARRIDRVLQHFLEYVDAVPLSGQLQRPNVTNHFVAIGASTPPFLMIPPATIPDGAANQSGFCLSVHGFHNLAYQTTTHAFRTPMTTARFGAVTGETEALFRGTALLPGSVDKCLIDNDRFIEVLNMTGCVLHAEESSTGFCG